MNKPFYGAAGMPLAQRSSIINHSEAPGPGTYDPSQERKHNDLPKWSLPKRIEHGSCFQDLSISPGPGGYDIEPCISKKSESKPLNKEEKFRQYVEKSYPQNNLHLPSAFQGKSGFSFGYREPFQELEKSPGPVYNLDKNVEIKRKSKVENSSRGFGFGNRDQLYKKDVTPGPGSFDSEKSDAWKSKTMGGWSFGGARKLNDDQRQAIGPGEYSPKSVNMTRGFKLTGRKKDKIIIDTNNGPGTYDIPDTKTKQGTKIGPPPREAAQDEDEECSDHFLSPCSYNPPRYLQESSGQGYSMGARPYFKQDGNGRPGPGTYEMGQKAFQSKSGGYMGRKTNEKKKETATDNFYKYDPQMSTVARGSPKFTFPQSRPSNQLCEQNRNRGFHQSLDHKKSGYSYSMGTAKRFTALKKEEGHFKENFKMSSTIGFMPGYLKKRIEA